MGMTVQGRGTAGSGGHGPVALRIPPGGDSASFHRAARPDWASFPGLSPASGGLPGFPLTPGAHDQQDATSFPQ